MQAYAALLLQNVLEHIMEFSIQLKVIHIFFYQQAFRDRADYTQECYINKVENLKLTTQTYSGSWRGLYGALAIFSGNGKVYMLGQTVVGLYWFISELLANGKFGADLDYGVWGAYYPANFVYKHLSNSKRYYYAQSKTNLKWSISELNDGGTHGLVITKGTWAHYYHRVFSYNSINGKSFMFAHTWDGNEYFIAELFSDSKLDSTTLTGSFDEFYSTAFSYTLNNSSYMFAASDNNWFKGALTDDGKINVITKKSWKMKIYCLL